MPIFLRTSVFILALFIAGCVNTPDGVEPVSPFDVERYAGQWYEIARLDHSFEQGLTNVTANYELRDDGTVKVTNRGYSTEENQWDEAVGKAKFVEGTNTGFLKVSFFGPFYGSYVVFELGEQYDYAFVAGPNTDYLWFLAREPNVGENLIKRFESEAKSRGFAVEDLIYVEHDQ